MKFKIIEMHIKGINSMEIARLFNLNIDFVFNTINEFLKEPYIIRQSKINNN